VVVAYGSGGSSGRSSRGSGSNGGGSGSCGGGGFLTGAEKTLHG